MQTDCVLTNLPLKFWKFVEQGKLLFECPCGVEYLIIIDRSYKVPSSDMS